MRLGKLQGWICFGRRLTVATLVSLCALVGLLALSSAPAWALQTHVFSTSFDGSGSNALSDPQGVAIDQNTGEVYVVDSENNRVEIFSASGVFISAFGAAGSGNGQFFDPTQVAVDNSGGLPGDVYVLDKGNERVEVFNAKGEYQSQVTRADLATTSPPPTDNAGALQGIAVDPSGNLWIYDGNANMYEFPTGGVLPGSFEFNTGFEVNPGLAIDSSGDLYVVRGAGVERLGSSGNDLGTVDTCGGCETAVAVDSVSGDLYTDDGTSVAHFLASNGSGTPDDSFGAIGPSALAQGSGIAVDGSTGSVYVADAARSTIDIFEPATLPDTKTEAAAGVSKIAATLHGAVNPDGIPVSACRFEYGTETGVYLHTVACSPVPGSGNTTVAVSAALTGLSVNTTYHYRLAATNAAGTNFGGEESFTTPQAVDALSTGAAEDVTASTAKLTGSLSPDGTDAHYYFEYGAEAGVYGSVSPALPGTDAGSASASVPGQTTVTNLTGNTTYHYRLVAVNAFGTTHGEDETFMTTGPPTVDSQSAGEIEQTSAMLHAQIDPHGFDTTYRFEYGTSTSYGTSVPVPDGDIGAGTSDEGVSAELTGLQAGVVYHYRVVAVNLQSPAGGTPGPDETFITGPAAQIESVSASNVTMSGATLNAKINPLSNDTTYHFEYGTSTAYGGSIPVPDADIGSGSSGVFVSQQIEGLSANTTYHYRIVAHNALGATPSADHVFVYDTSGGGLPDNRAYEMVTPPQKNGALIGRGFAILQPDISEDGSRVILSSIQCFAGSGSCTATRQFEGEQYLFTHSGGGWVTMPLAPPAPQFEANTGWLVSAETGMELFSMPTPPMDEGDFYVRRPGGSFVDVGPVTPPSEGPAALSGPEAATSDFSHVVYVTRSLVWPFDAGSRPSLLEYVGTGNTVPFLVAVSGGSGSTDLISSCGGELGAPDGLNPGPGRMSADGRTVYFTAEACSSGTGANAFTPVPAAGVYARIDGELPDAHTVAISQSECDEDTKCKEAEAHPAYALFAGASVDGSKAFFTSTQQLTGNASEDSQTGDTAQGCSSTIGPNGCNLYEYDFANPTGHNLIDVSAGDTSGHGPRVRGVMAISSDGSHVYFVAKGVLTATVNSQGETAQDGANNLYVFERNSSNPEGHVAFIASLPDQDEEQWLTGPSQANVTPDGSFLVFESQGDLTPDDTRQDGAQQVFRYDAQTGVLRRISIGEHGFNDNGNHPGGRVCVVFFFCPDSANIVHAEAGGLHGGAARPDPTMSHDGTRVFFESPVGLTAQALNEVQIGTRPGESGPIYAENVYEWEQEGVGSCPAGQSSGCVYLISDGRDTASNNSGENSAVQLWGSDATGANVFFSTTDQLVPQDTDTQLDYYDARTCTTSEPCVPPPPASQPPCLGEACHGIPAATPSLLTPGTASFNGQGNITPAPTSSVAKPKAKAKALTRAQKLADALRACKKKPKKMRVACARQARRKYGVSKAMKSNRRAK